MAKATEQSELISVLENGIAVYAPKSEFANERLQQLTQRIYELTQQTKRNLFEIAVNLLAIDSEKLYQSAGFNSTVEYAEKNFGYKQAMTYKLISVARKFIEFRENGFYSKLAHDNVDYSVSQLMELDRVEFDEAKNFDALGVITPDKTTKDIRAIIDDYKHGEIDNNGQPVKPVKRDNTDNESNNENDNTTRTLEPFSGDIANEFSEIIIHCRNLLNVIDIANDSKQVKKIQSFMSFCTKSASSFKAKTENQEGTNAN